MLYVYQYNEAMAADQYSRRQEEFVFSQFNETFGR